MKAKRIIAALGAVWILGSLAAPASAKQVNTETKEQEKHYGDTYVGDPDWGEPIGHLGEGDAFWSEQPFDSYWTDRGRSNYAGHDRSGMWLMTNYYYSGEGHTVAVDDPRFKAASYLGIRTVLGCRVFTENEWNLEKVSEKTEDYVNELVYVGEVYTGDTIETICTDYNIARRSPSTATTTIRRRTMTPPVPRRQLSHRRSTAASTPTSARSSTTAR